MPLRSGPLLGAHMSIAGGYDKAVLAAAQAGCDVVQLFTKNNTQWRARPIRKEEQRAFHEALEETGVRHPIAHSCYLINLASSDRELWKKSLDALVDELRRAESLGLDAVVVHPGSYGTTTQEQGIGQVIRALNQALRRTARLHAGVLLETTAGQGTALGWRLEQLAEMLGGLVDPARVGVCLDTCHLFAAGYPIHTSSGYEETMRQLQETIGLSKIKAIHVNDSKRALGSRVDRHDHPGQGQLGLEAFRYLLNDPRLYTVPMYLETPKGTKDGEDCDVINLRTLRALCKPPQPS